MADEQILSREGGFELAKRTITDALNTPSGFMRAQALVSLKAIDRHDAALRAQVAAMAEWAAKVEHGRSCASWYCGACGSPIAINKCSNPFCITNESPDAMHLLKRGCNCVLASLPADLIARGRELLDAAYMRGFADGTKGTAAAIDAAICKVPAPKQGDPCWLADEVL